MTTFSRNTILSVLAFLAFLTLTGISRQAHAAITITPTIVTIEDRQRYADVNLINTSNETQTYELGWRFFKMAEGTGTYQSIDHSTTDFDLTKSLIYSPKRVTLAPNGMQKIRLALRLNGEAPAAGDYRAHLEFTQVIENGNEKAPAAAPNEKGRMNVGVGVNVAFSIPVIFRVGTADTTISMGDISTRVNEKKHALEAIVPITRTGGPFGLAGDLSVYHTPKGGKEVRVGQVKNANIFPEANSRVFEVSLNTNTLQDGSLRVVLKDSNANKKIIYAEKIIPIGN